MSNGDLSICESVRTRLNASRISFTESDIQHATKFSCEQGVHKAGILVYKTKSIHVDGANSELKTWLTELKKSIENGTGGPCILLPSQIEALPETLKSRVPKCDPVITWYLEESLRCYKAASYAGAAFMLGAASEKAICTLIDSYADSIADDENKTKFTSRINSKIVSVKWNEFKRSYKSAKPKPTDILAQDLDQLLDGAFNFYRHSRNSVGHPQIIPDLDPGVVLANIAQFVTYTERIYGLIDFFEQNKITV